MAPLIGYSSSSSMTFRTIGPAHGVYNFALATSQRVRVLTFRAFWAFLMAFSVISLRRWIGRIA